MLTTEQVEFYIEKKLEISGDWRSKLKESKLNFLIELVKATGCKMYYENITMGALSASERRAPTVPDVINQILTSAGGACVHLNNFTKMVLDHLEYDVSVVHGEVPFLAIPMNHAVLIVKIKLPNIQEEQMYLVDVGFGRPIYEPIPLNNLPYIGKAGGFAFEIRYNTEKNVYERYLHGGCPIKGKFEAGLDGRVDYFFHVTPLQFDDFHEAMEAIFTDPSVSFFLNTILLFKFTKINSPQDFHYICFRGKTLTIGTANDRTESSFHSYGEMLPTIEKYFPKLNKDHLVKALFNYDNKMTKS